MKRFLQFAVLLFNVILILNCKELKAEWGDKPCPPGQFGPNKRNDGPPLPPWNPNKARINNPINNQRQQVNQNKFDSSNGVIHIRNGNPVFVRRDGTEISGTLDNSGNFRPSNGNLRNNGQNKNPNNNIMENISQADIAFTRIQYKQLCNSDTEDILLALETKDPRVLAGACTAAAEYDLDVVEKLIDLIGNDNDLVAQCARKGLLIKSFYLMNKIKKQQNQKVDFNFKPNPINLEKFANNKALEIGKDFVDFGPMTNDDNLAINASTIRWQTWFKKNEAKLSKGNSIKNDRK